MEASCMSSLETSKRTGQFYRRLQKRTAEEEVLEEEEYSRSGVENDLSHTNGDISKNGAAFFLPTEIDVNCFISNGCTLFIKGKPISKPGSGFKEEYTSDADNGLTALGPILAVIFLDSLSTFNVSFFCSCFRTSLFDADDDRESTTEDDISKAPGTFCFIGSAAAPNDNGASGGGSDCLIDPFSLAGTLRARENCADGFAGSLPAPDNEGKDNDDAVAAETT
ncbi:uncharacterized protein LOC121601562 isoform X1 [Anopheles merus]|uniref:uncharacterized protein LOC121601562 isoform X1 n=1 Tax=Anopheles merus TaxID=30066 RepID=UPI001BE40F9C|nr:uncharacterized protein LOC121601562 isoform X1 [Anopheles merus]